MGPLGPLGPMGPKGPKGPGAKSVAFSQGQMVSKFIITVALRAQKLGFYRIMSKSRFEPITLGDF